MANAQRLFDNINKLKVNGEMTDPECIKGDILDFYKILYAETDVWRPDFTYENIPRIS